MGAHPKSRKQHSIIEPYKGKLPPWPDNIGKRKRIPAITGEIRHFTIKDEIRKTQFNNKKKLIVFQVLQLEGTKTTEFRLGYYMIGEKPGARGRWVWGQFCLHIPARDMEVILRRARLKGWLK